MDLSLILAGVLVPVALALGGWVARLQSKLADARTCAKSDVGKVWAELSAFKVRVAEDYAKQTLLHDLEAKMEARFDKVDDKLERILNGRKS